jgi:hypothetical protein
LTVASARSGFFNSMFSLVLVGVPLLFYAFRLYTRAVQDLRSQYPESYAALGSPSDFLPPSPGSGSNLASQFLLLKLILFLPKALPDDGDIRAKLRRVQLICRLWNLACIPVAVWFFAEVGALPAAWS